MDDNTTKKKYLSEIIGDSFKTWKPYDVVTITAPTGCGKTHFCLHTYSKYILEQNTRRNQSIYSDGRKAQRILYLVNRTILKKQIEEEIRKISNTLEINSTNTGFPLSSIITVNTYQNIESQLSNANTPNNWASIDNYYSSYDIVIYDEAHYFFSDSNFNTYTALSYNFLRYKFNNKIQIFMSATMDNMTPLIKKYHPYLNYLCDKKSNYLPSYSGNKDYSYVTLVPFHNKNDIVNIISNDSKCKNEKWLVFVDSKDYGRELESLLTQKENSNNITRSDVIYIDSKYKQNEKSLYAVNTLTKSNYLNQKIIITTAVMDNGISFHDTSLRNIVIFADTEEEFIQMLGRKREDGQKVTVYACLHDSEHFRKRLQSIQGKEDRYNDCLPQISSLYNIEVTNAQQHYYIMENNHSTISYNPIERIFHPIPIPVFAQQNILKKLLEDESFYNNCKSFLYFFYGIVAINPFASTRIIKLRKFYEDMQIQLKSNPFAFINKVYDWLEIPDSERHGAINFENDQKIKLQAIVENYKDKELSKELCIQLKKATLNSIKYLLTPHNFESSVITRIKKNDRGYQPDDFNQIMSLLGLPYVMNLLDKNKGIFKITTSN